MALFHGIFGTIVYTFSLPSWVALEPLSQEASLRLAEFTSSRGMTGFVEALCMANPASTAVLLGLPWFSDA